MDLKNRTIAEVLEHHLYHVQHCNLDEALEDYCEDSVIITQDGVKKGLSQIRAFFAESMKSCLPPESVYESSLQTIHDNLAFTVFSAESPFYSLSFGTDTYLIEKGVIIRQTFAGILTKKEK
jgi:ketosteroid isomerase-like protein